MGSASSIIAGAAFVKIALDSAELTKGLDQAQGKFKRFISGLNAWSTTVGLNAAMLQAPFRKAIEVFSDFDLKMRQVKAITGATGAAFDELSAHARKLGRETSFTTSQVASAMVALGRLGFTIKEVKDATRPVMNLAKSTGSDLAEAAMVAGNNMRVFGLNTSEMGDITDVVVATVNKSAQTLNDFAEASAKAGPNFYNTGSNIKEMSASLGILANMGIRGSLAGTALSRSIKRLADPKVQEFLKSYGVEVVDLNGNMKPLHKNLQSVAKIMNTLSHSERIHIAEQIFEVRGSLAGLPLTTSSQAIEDFLKSLENCGNVASRTANEMDTGIYGALKRLESAFNDVCISIGKMFTVSWIGWIEAIAKAVNWLNKEDSVISGIVKTSLNFGVVFATLGSVLKLAQMFGSAIINLFQPLLKLDELLTNAAGKAKMAADAEQLRSLEMVAANARVIASEKALTASTLAESSKRQAELLKEAKLREKNAVAQLTAGKTTEAHATTEISKANANYTKDYSGLEQSVLLQDKELKAIETQNTALAKKVIRERQSVDTLNDELTKRQRASVLAQKEAQDARDQLALAQTRNKAQSDVSGVIAQKKAAMELAQTKRDAATQEFQTSTKKLATLKSELIQNQANKKIATERLDSYKKKVNEGHKEYIGLSKIESNRLNQLKLQTTELQKQLNIQKDIVLQKTTAFKSAERQYSVDRKAYNEMQPREVGKSVIDTTAINEEVARKEAIAQTALQEEARAASVLRAAQARHAMAVREFEDNNNLLVQSKQSLATDMERLAAAQKSRDGIVLANKEIAASASEANIALAAQVKLLHGETVEAERVYNASKKSADAALDEANKAKKKAEEASNTAKTFAYTSNPQKKLNQDLELAQAQLVAAKKDALNAQTYLKQASYEKDMAVLKKQNGDIEIATLQEVSASEDARAQKSIAILNEEIELTLQKHQIEIECQYKKIEVLKQEMATHKQLLAQIELEKKQYMDTLNQKQVREVKKGWNIKVNGYDKDIKDLNKKIALSEKAIQVEKSGIESINSKYMTTIANDKARIDLLNSEIQKRATLTKTTISQNSNSGWEAYVAAEKEIDAKIKLERANSVLSSSEAKLAIAQKAARTASQSYANVLVKAGAGHQFAAAMSFKHYQQILKTSIADVFAAAKTVTGSKLKAAGYSAEAAAAKVAAVATLGLKTAMDFIAKHPVLIALALLSAAYLLLKRSLDNAAKSANNYADAMAKQAENASIERNKLEKKIEQERDDLKYLQELGNQTSLTQEQQDSARQIIEELTNTYGELGIKIDSVTGKLYGEADAIRKVGAQQKQMMLDKLNQELELNRKTTQARQTALEATMRKESGVFGGGLSGDQVSDDRASILKELGYELESYYKVDKAQGRMNVVTPAKKYVNKTDTSKMTDKELEDYIKKLNEAQITAIKNEKLGENSPEAQSIGEIINLLKKELDYREKIAAIKKNNNPLANANETNRAPITPAPTKDDVDNAAKKIGELTNEAYTRNDSSVVKRLDEIDKKRKELSELSKKQIEYYDNEIKIAKAEMKANSKKRNKEEITNYKRNEKRLKELEDEQLDVKDATQNLNDEYDRWTDEVKKNADREAQRQIDIDENAIQEMQDRQTESDDRKNENERFQTLLSKKNYSGLIKELDSLWNSNTLSMQLATQQYNNLVRSAKAGGFYNGTMNEQDRIDTSNEMSKLREEIQKYISRESELKDKYAEVRKSSEEAVKTNSASVGSFSAKALSRSIGQDGMQARIVRATESSQTFLAVVSTNVNLALQQLRTLNTRLGVLS